MDYSETGGGAAGGLILVVYIAVLVLMIVSMWKIFTKAGQPGWASIIPIYNIYVLLQIVGKPGWWLVLFFIPLVNMVIGIIAMIALAENFGKGGGFSVGLILLGVVFFPILAFGGAQYVGSSGGSTSPAV